MRAFPVLPRLDQTSELLVRGGKHLQPLQCRHGEGEILLRAVQPFDVCCHLGDGPLGFQCSFPDALDLREQRFKLRLRILYAAHAVRIGGGLHADNGGEIMVEVILVSP